MKTLSVVKSYGKKTVLSMPETDFEKGKIYAVIGGNGSGKTTFARLLAGIEKDDSGKTALPKGIKTGYMPQKSYAFRMSTLSNVKLVKKDGRRAEELMQMLDIRRLASSRAKQLSGGETAKMALARLFMDDYDIIILDEPTASMDLSSTILTEDLIKKTAQKGSAVVIVTHSLQQARRLADFVLFLHEGKLAESGRTQDVLDSPQNEETKRFIEFFGI